MRTRKGWAGCWLLAVVGAVVALGACTEHASAGDDRPLRIAMGSPPTTLDPQLHDEAVTYMVLANVYEGLTAFDREMQVRPSLAVGWENPDDRTWRLHLRPNVHFQDGHVLNAADVVFSIERAKRLPASRVGHYVSAIDSARAVDSLTVELRTSRSYPILLSKLPYVMILPAGTPDSIRTPVGTGPYRIASFDGRSRLTLERYDGYWGGVPKTRSATLLFTASPTRRAAMARSGEADLAMLIGTEDVPGMSRDACCRVESRTGLPVSYIGLDTRTGPTRDVRVRRAISLAIDRKAIVDSVYRGFAKPAGQMVSPEVFGYAPDITVPRPDTAAARRLLAEAGYPQGFALVLETTKPREAETRMLASQLARVGIRLDVQIMPWETLYRRRIDDEVHAYTASVVCTSGDASDLLDAFLHSRQPGTTWGESNWTSYANARVDAMAERAATTADMRQRRSVMQEALRMTTDDLPMIPLWTLDRIYAVRSDIAWKPRLDGVVKVADIRRR